MSLITDLRAVSDNAIEQVAARFADLPRPLLAAIGAGDMAIERLAELREQVESSVGERVAGTPLDVKDVRATVTDLPGRAQKAAADLPGRAQQVAADLQGRAQKAAADLPGKAQQLAADLPGKAQKAAADLPAKAQQVAADLPSKAQQVAADVAGNIEQFAADAPGKAQDLIAQLPGRLAEFQAAAKSLSPDAIKETIEAYTQLVGMIYGKLAERGDKSWTKARTIGLHPGAIVDAVAAKARPAKSAAGPSATAAAASDGAAATAGAAAENAREAAETITDTAAAMADTSAEPADVAPSAKSKPAAKVTEPTPISRRTPAETTESADPDAVDPSHVVPPGAHVKHDED